MFVAVDGPNGVGKTSLVAALARTLRDKGHRVQSLRQPSDSDFGRFIRSAEHGLRGMSLATLVVADRLWQVNTLVQPALDNGEIVITDRHIASTLVLQRIDGLAIETLWELNADVLTPDVQIVLTASPDTIRTRLDDRGRLSRFEQSEGIEALEDRYYREAAAWLEQHDIPVILAETDAVGVDELAAQLATVLVARLD